MLFFSHQVHGLALDAMHIFGGGAAMEGLKAIFALGKKYSSPAYKMDEVILNLVDTYLDAWKKPLEFVRDVQNIRQVSSDWKMRVAHDMVLYHMVALLSIPEIRRNIDKVTTRCKVSDLFMCLVIGMRLIGMETHESPSTADMTFARECLNSYVRGFIRIFGPAFCTSKNHLLVHFAEEVAYYSSHLGGFDAYVFESFLARIRKKMVKTPKNPLAQVYNSLAKAAYHAHDGQNGSGEINRLIQEKALIEAVKQHGSMNLPAWTIEDSNVRSNPEKKYSYIKCHGFKVTLE